MDWALKIIIGLLIINIFWLYSLKKEIVNPKRYYLIYGSGDFVSHIESNGQINTTWPEKSKWRLPNAIKAKEDYPNLKIIDCITMKEVKEL